MRSQVMNPMLVFANGPILREDVRRVAVRDAAVGTRQAAVYRVPIAVNGSMYHPTNVALLPWFASDSTSSAIYGAYS
jgi:hypothetical protein